MFKEENELPEMFIFKVYSEVDFDEPAKADIIFNNVFKHFNNIAEERKKDIDFLKRCYAIEFKS